MKKHKLWSYAPYRPPFTEIGDIYICRIVPTTDTILLEWQGSLGKSFVYCKEINSDEFIKVGETDVNSFEIKGLVSDTDYCFYVENGEKKSRIRLARCGNSVGTTVNYLHPEDEAYKFSGRYLCSPSMVRHPDGFLLASMDLYAGGHPQNLT